MENNSSKSNRIIAVWVFVGIAMLLIQVLLGGITRLTGSGLSITEWKPIMGTIPPLNDAEWQQAFDKYKQIAQYKYINNHFTLHNFKIIFFWEWFHRLWARVILAVAFFIPFIYFLKKRMITKSIANNLIILVLLGAVEGTLGWIMVKSGLNDENVYVNHIKLAIHFIMAMFIISYATTFALNLCVTEKVENIFLKKRINTIIVLVAIQLVYGAFMAGLKGAVAAPTWPSINGEYFPNFISNGLLNGVVFNIIGVHFIHRTLAYIIGILILLWWLKARNFFPSSLFNKIKSLPLILVFVQIILGIASILLSPKIVLGSFGIFEFFALLHQLTGMLLLLSLVSCRNLLSK